MNIAIPIEQYPSLHDAGVASIAFDQDGAPMLVINRYHQFTGERLPAQIERLDVAALTASLVAMEASIAAAEEQAQAIAELLTDIEEARERADAEHGR